MLRILSLGTIFFLACRLLLLLFYPDYFAPLSNYQLALAFVNGIRFDLALLVLALAPVFLLLSLPLKVVYNRYVLNVLAVVSSLLMAALIGIYIADIAYFAEVKRHMGQDLLRLDADFSFIWQLAISSRLHTTIIGLAIIGAYVLGAYFLLYKFRKPQHMVSKLWQKLLLMLVTVLLLVFLARGMRFGGKPISYIDAFAQGSQQAGNLALNGAYATIMEAYKYKNSQLEFLDAAQFAKLEQQLQSSGSLEHMFKRQINSHKKRALNDQLAGKNVVIVMLESVSYKFIDALGGNDYRATPYLDSLIAKSQVWDNFYAAGQRSILGIQAVLTSTPVLPSQAALGFGLELRNFSKMGKIAAKQGYETLLVQSSARGSFHMQGIAKSLGFKHYYGKEDMPMLLDYPGETKPAFGYDYETLQFALDKIDNFATDKPFLSFIFTGTTHEPYINPGKEFLIRPHNSNSFDGFLNTLRYTDYSLEQFMRRFAQTSQYQNTLFLIMADHVLRAQSTSPQDAFHIPLIIYTPDGSLPPERKTAVAGQYDILPTVAQILGTQQPVYSFGESLFRAQRHNYTAATAGDVVHFIGENSWASFIDKQQLEQQPAVLPKVEKEKLQQLKFRLQYAQQLLKNNRWAD